MELRTVFFHFLCVLFGLGTWVCVNGLWVELPLLVSKQPEGWKLPSYMSVAICLANIAPILYSVANSLVPKYVNEKPMIYLTNAVGITATILLILFWEETSYVFGSERSTALITLVFFLAMVDCSSRVLYLPFMGNFQEKYLTSFFIGEGMSGLVPSVFALIQGVGGNPECVEKPFVNATLNTTIIEASYPEPRFAVEMFFAVLLAIVIASISAFHLMNYDSVVGFARVGGSIPLTEKGSKGYGSTENNNAIEEQSDAFKDYGGPSKELDSRVAVLYLLGMQVIVCFMANGMFPSIQTYSCLPYGTVAYHWAVTLSNMANPGVCFLTFVLPPPSKKSVSGSAVLGFGVAAYVLTTALMSPTPPMQGQTSGEVVLVFGWILMVGLFTYVRISVASIFRERGKNGLFWVGAVTQLGSASGALITFFIVEYTTVFQGYYPC